MARHVYGYETRNPLLDNVRYGIGGVAGGRFIVDDGTTPVPVHGWLVRLDGVLILRLDGEVPINTLP